MAKTEGINAEEFKNIKEQLSDDEKSGNIGKVLDYIISTLQSGWSFLRTVQDLNSLQDIQKYKKEISGYFEKLLEENLQNNEDIAKKLKNCFEKNQSSWTKFCSNEIPTENLAEILQGNADSVKKIQEEVLNAIDNHHQSECNKVIQDMTKGREIMAVLYFVKLYIAWKKVSAASNVIADKTKFIEIENNIKNLGEMVAELVKICRTDKVQESINKKMTLITTEYTTTLSLISDVRVKIDGHIQTLDLLGDVAAVDSAMCFAKAVTHGYEVWSVWDKLTSPTKLVGVASTALFAFFGMTNAGVWYLTRQKIAQLRDDLQRVNIFKRDLDDVYKKAKQAIAV